MVRFATIVPDTVGEEYDYEKSTEENHAASNGDDGEAIGEFEVHRETLDYTYHSRYSRDRQRLQDNIIRQLLRTVVEDAKTHMFSDRPMEPWVVFTAGAMGAGKSHCMRFLSEKGLFSLASFVQVDPDIIRFELPEMPGYLSRDKTTAGTLTHKEAGFIVEILTLAGLDSGKNVIVDGSLRDAEWNALFFERIRKDYPNYRIAIIHVVAEPEEVIRRAEARAEKTGRVVPKEKLLDTLEAVPRSVAKLAPLTDYTICIKTDGPEPAILTEGESWTTFAERWKQECGGRVASTMRMVKGFTRGFTQLHGLWGDECKTREVERMKMRSEHKQACLPLSCLPPFRAM
jgi:predicted kinase